MLIAWLLVCFRVKVPSARRGLCSPRTTESQPLTALSDSDIRTDTFGSMKDPLLKVQNLNILQHRSCRISKCLVLWILHHIVVPVLLILKTQYECMRHTFLLRCQTWLKEATTVRDSAYLQVLGGDVFAAGDGLNISASGARVGTCFLEPKHLRRDLHSVSPDRRALGRTRYLLLSRRSGWSLA
jgi:hypothetical protein